MDQPVTSERTHCIRCGECCLGSSPTLQMADVSLVYDGFIERRKLYTIRLGELVRDNIRDELRVTDKEIIKIKENINSSGCIYYNEKVKACTIYEYRPIQCKALACWDESEFMRVYARPKADRRDIIRDKIVLSLMKEHDKRGSYMELDRYVRRIKKYGEEAVEKILEVLKFDQHIRTFTSKKLGIGLSEMDFLFGRPLIDTIKMFGLKVIKQPDGSFFLTVLDSHATPL
ncbi:MAG: YkgJ family cysteine cluster protein [Desulfobacteraceae bacterium]|nr:MAG: YkgJ family cysteine cluster protein [Desulfobacteraceae bacterium]